MTKILLDTDTTALEELPISTAVQTALNGKAAKAKNIRTETASATFALTDDIVRMDVASANTITVPPNASVAFPVGTLLFVTQVGAGATTIAAGSGVTIDNPASATLAIDEVDGSRAIYQYAANTWTLV